MNYIMIDEQCCLYPLGFRVFLYYYKARVCIILCYRMCTVFSLIFVKLSDAVSILVYVTWSTTLSIKHVYFKCIFLV